jgi:trans-2,3-dihydro-3-hydroxyanthranilate isomerase
MKARYLLVDVFTEKPLAGNALAVFPDGHDIPEELMQPIAREINLSETTFVTACTGDAYDLRIFTPGAEMPFAGHPTLGTAWVLRHLGRLEGDRALQRTGAGDTPVSIAFDAVWLERAGSVGEDLEDVSFVAAALGLDDSDVGFSAALLGMERTMLSPAVADSGVEQLMVPVADPTTLAGLAPRPEIADLSGDGVYCFAPIAPTKIKARFFAPGVGVFEDPGTGSAAAGLGLYLGARLGDLAFDIVQGEEVGRPSTIMVDTARGRVRVGGSVALAGEGELRL